MASLPASAGSPRGLDEDRQGRRPPPARRRPRRVAFAGGTGGLRGSPRNANVHVSSSPADPATIVSGHELAAGSPQLPSDDGGYRTVRFHWYQERHGAPPLSSARTWSISVTASSRSATPRPWRTIRGSGGSRIASRHYFRWPAVAPGVPAPRGQETAPAPAKLSRPHGRPPSAPATLHASR